jgi:hypothetical protein
MRTKELFFATERQNAPLTTGQICELENKKLRNIETFAPVKTDTRQPINCAVSTEKKKENEKIETKAPMKRKTNGYAVWELSNSAERDDKILFFNKSKKKCEDFAATQRLVCDNCNYFFVSNYRF